jgi:hypothetical protein
MSLVAFQQALSELVMSPEFCTAVRTDPQQALSAFDLTPLEHQRLISVATQPGLEIGTAIHRSFRMSMLVNTLPKTCMVLKLQNLTGIIHEYWRSQLPRNLYYVQEAVRFGEYMLARLELGKLQDEFLEEVLRFELAVLSLTREPYRQKTLNEKSANRDPQTSFPYLNPRYRIVYFRHEPESLFAALDEGRMPERIKQENSYLLLAQSSAKQLRIQPIGSRLGEVLSACNGKSSAALLCKQLSLTVRDLEALTEASYLSFRSSCVD